MDNLSTYLKDNDISQAEFARRIGIHSSVLCRYLGKQAKPSLEKAVAIERETGGLVSASSWFSNTDAA